MSSGSGRSFFRLLLPYRAAPGKHTPKSLRGDNPLVRANLCRFPLRSRIIVPYTLAGPLPASDTCARIGSTFAQILKKIFLVSFGNNQRFALCRIIRANFCAVPLCPPVGALRGMFSTGGGWSCNGWSVVNVLGVLGWLLCWYRCPLLGGGPGLGCCSRPVCCKGAVPVKDNVPSVVGCLFFPL